MDSNSSGYASPTNAEGSGRILGLTDDKEMLQEMQMAESILAECGFNKAKTQVEPPQKVNRFKLR